eukprot:4152247-Pleurochrysis_carterae.AAC.1
MQMSDTEGNSEMYVTCFQQLGLPDSAGYALERGLRLLWRLPELLRAGSKRVVVRAELGGR